MCLIKVKCEISCSENNSLSSSFYINNQTKIVELKHMHARTLSYCQWILFLIRPVLMSEKVLSYGGNLHCPRMTMMRLNCQHGSHLTQLTVIVQTNLKDFFQR